MRTPILAIGTALTMICALTTAQEPVPSQEPVRESLCNPCVDLPVIRGPITPPNATNVITAMDMRALGVISVADMVNQLPSGVAPQAAIEAGENAAAAGEYPPAETVTDESKSADE